MEFINSKYWLKSPTNFIVIAGPCSAESEYQIMTLAEQFKKTQKVSLMRAGVWKPRTRPNSFEGLGEKALPWLIKAEREFGIPVVIEVANEIHVKKALDAGISHVWIGARTTVNPFSVQEIAECLSGSDIPVLVKNPLNPDLKLWIGALERLEASGIKKLIAVHRGFNTYQDHVFRNTPNWEIPIELKTRFPKLEILVDPSHIGGKPSLLREISQKALDLGFDGLMIEVHPNPDLALSDAKQQLALNQFDVFLNDLEHKRLKFDEDIALDQLAHLRQLIDEIDHNLLENLKRRLEIVHQIGEYKAQHGVTVFQVERWRQIIRDRVEYGKEKDMDETLIRSVWSEIHQASIRLQTEIVNQSIYISKQFD